MKQFRCGDVVPGCAARFTGTEEEILRLVGEHATRDHQVEVTPELVVGVRAAMTLA